MATIEINPIKLPNIKNIIGIFSGKGGVGKTFVATSLALALAKAGKSVGLLDADISCPNVFKALGITNKIRLSAENRILPIEKYGVKIVSMAGLAGAQDEAIVWRGPIVSKILQKFMKETVWGDIEILIVDFPSGAGDIALTMLQNFEVNGLIAVTTPQDMSVIDVIRSINMANMLKVPVIGVVENMRGEFFGEGGGSRTADYCKIPLICSIPMRRQIVALTDSGVPPVFHSDELQMMFSKIARVVGEKIMA